MVAYVLQILDFPCKNGSFRKRLFIEENKMATYKGEARKLRRALGSFNTMRVIDKNLLASLLEELMGNIDYKFRQNIANEIARQKEMRLAIVKDASVNFRLRPAKELKTFDWEKLLATLDLHHTLQKSFVYPGREVSRYGSQRLRLHPAVVVNDLSLAFNADVIRDFYRHDNWQYMWATLASLILEHRDRHDANYLLSDGRTNYFFMENRGRGWDVMPIGIAWDIEKEDWCIKAPNLRIPKDSRVFLFCY